MADKPNVTFDAGDDSFDPEQVEQETKRDKVPFSTVLRPSLYERLRAAAFWEDTSIAGLTADALRAYLDALEAERGEPYEVLSPHKIKSS